MFYHLAVYSHMEFMVQFRLQQVCNNQTAVGMFCPQCLNQDTFNEFNAAAN